MLKVVLETYWDIKQACNSSTKIWHAAAATIIMVHKLSLRQMWGLLALNGSIYVAHEEQRCTKTSSTQHEEESVAYTSHVAEEEWGLHEARHAWSRMIVINAVEEDEYTSGASAKNRPEDMKRTTAEG